MTTLRAITGASGHVGGMTARHLADAGLPIRLVVRDPSRAPSLLGADVAVASYDDGDACLTAFEGVDTLFLVSATESADRVQQHQTAIDAAVAAGVRQVVYLSFAGAGADATFLLARDHGATEEYLKATPLEWTFLRDNLYTEALRAFATDGAIRGPGGQGRVASVSQVDVAAAAAHVLADPTGHVGRAYTLTGPEALTLGEVAALLSEATGVPVTYVDETIEEAFASRAHYGAPRWMVEAWISTYTAIRDGELAHVTSDLPDLLGRPALSVAEVFSGRR
ncbi:SDR family oxidoreductase [Mumia sp. ZJ1417]|uniref:SDR family oxidoreductase n=1 Tax=Mumia sp. ZJ1417 TaxID=2708082 RepID=UPI00141E7EA7|nr:SDR family oxidoreductase [Mumia sp. ZJ1417]QMW66292.1 SDR family oxidoreductase [Mumia sp. ZJ1417]